MVRVFFQLIRGEMLKGTSSLMFLKIILGLSLLGFSAMRQEGMDEREAEDSVNDYGRSAVGESKEETVRLYLLFPSVNRISLIKA